MTMKLLFAAIFLIPVFCFSQDPVSSDTILQGKMFSVPSPSQAIMLVQDQEPLSDTIFIGSFAKTESKKLKALRTGLLEADLIYGIYIDSSIIDTTVAKIKSYTTGIFENTAVFDNLKADLNDTTRDSIHEQLSNTFRYWDMKLKDENKSNISTMIILGGWVESMFILSEYALETSDERLLIRVSEQKISVNSLVEMVENINVQEGLDFILMILIDLQDEYNRVVTDYHYEKPVENTETRTTTFGHSTETKTSKDHVANINDYLIELRYHITQLN
jgi:hypothetical protein